MVEGWWRMVEVGEDGGGSPSTTSTNLHNLHNLPPQAANLPPQAANLPPRRLRATGGTRTPTGCPTSS